MEETNKLRIEKDNDDYVLKNSNGENVHVVIEFDWYAHPRLLLVRNMKNHDQTSFLFRDVGNIEEFAKEEFPKEEYPEYYI
jgi:hypothetical protein